jgi:hypothetical protein
MLVHQAQVGMKVMFGRPNGDQTLGEIVKVNPSKAKVKTLEIRGNGRGSEVGSVWTVPYSLMKPAGVAFLDEVNSLPPLSLPKSDPAEEPIPYNEFSDTNIIMEAIVDTYNRLSPEWLTCDGELPLSQVNARRKEYGRRLRGLFMALGRDVSETVAFDWADAKRSKKVTA